MKNIIGDGSKQSVRIVDDLQRDVYCVLGIPLDATSMPAVLQRIRAAAAGAQRLFISTPNVNFLVHAQSDPKFRESLLVSDVCPPDGVPIVWLARLMGISIGKVSGSDMFEALKSSSGPGSPLKIFLFGGTEEVTAEASRRMNQGSLGLRCVGWLCPGFGDLDDLSRDDFIEQINSSHADILVAALGAQKGQLWLLRNRNRLRPPVRTHLGATINFQAGTVKRAPSALQKLGLEWLWRIKEEPRLFKRYWYDGRVLLWLVLTRALPLAISLRWLKVRAKRSENEFEITIHDYDEMTVALRLSGYATALQVRESITCFAEALASRKRIVVDVSNVRGIDFRFLGLLLMLHKLAAGRGDVPNLTGASSSLRRQFRLSGVEYLLA